MIRFIQEEDTPAVMELLKTLKPSQEVVGKKLSDEIGRLTAIDHMRLIGFESDDKIVGMCTLIRNEGLSYGGRPFAVIENVVVNEDYQGKGIGKKVVSHAIELAKEWNCYKVILETGSKEEWKLQFYESCGLERGFKTAFIRTFE
ncbi:MAG: GNAT family N-acetyltransferase [Spirochaetales bacterium]|nr:GNAT family N-acetyltransferase [Spirochaetales bacterium]